MTSREGRARGLAGPGLLAVLGAMLVNVLVAASARALGVDFELPDGGESIPLPGFATVTGFFSLLGVALALAARRWSDRPAQLFLRVTLGLTAISLVPPLLVGADTSTTSTLVLLHLLAAVIVMPTLVRALRRPSR
jgi:uncharacterized membrane protein YhaH (DUF805 family)